ncbi:MAG: hypothetical protein IBJ03_04530 [Gemmatimonadaceae bacterium]|nr:hypothetical protein [Gemmatimonadaceae bacterium]
MPSKVVNLDEHRDKGVRVFSGRGRGEIVRDNVRLESLEKEFERISIYVPEDVFVLTSSFFLGMFDLCIRRLGEAGFRAKYEFTGKDIARIVDESIVEALKDGSPLPERA